MTNTTPSPTTGRISLAHLTRSPSIQVRTKLDQPTVTRYATAIKSGQELPPVLVALVDGVYILLDGFHRVAAHEALGADSVLAQVVETTLDDAQWRAAKANLAHGLPLKNKELREVFRVYIRTKQHRLGKGKMKSYRDIAEDIGKTHGTIYNWMWADFPRLAADYHPVPRPPQATPRRGWSTWKRSGRST